MKPMGWMVVLGVMIMAQWGVPVTMIARREAALKHGEVYKFKTRPVDPYDAFRGRYVALGFDVSSLPADRVKGELKHRMKAWAILEEGTNGFVTITSVQRERPREGGYIPVRFRSSYKGTAHLALPLNRYYMNEKAAPEAERAYRANSRRDSLDAYALVRVKNGFPVIESLVVGDEPIEEFIRPKPEE